MALQPVIQIEKLTKTYKQGQPPALKELNLTVHQGEIFGYLGPNGAGKTTTIRILLDLIRPTSGSARMLGLDVRRGSVALHKRIGFLPGELSLWDGLTGHEVIRYVSRIRGSLDQVYLKQLVDRLSLDLSKKVRSYSSGNRRKLGLVLAMMHQPELLILDEPTGGLDPLMQQTLHQMMREARDSGRTVFLSSHILSEVQAICERVAILKEGALKAVQRVDDLVHVNFHWITFTFRQPVAPERIAGLPDVADVTAQDNTLKLRLSGDIDPLLRRLDGEYIVNIHTQDPSLEEIFLAFYGNNTHQSEAAAKNIPAQAMEVAK